MARECGTGSGSARIQEVVAKASPPRRWR